MRVSVDKSVCEGYGTCAQIFPELFRLDEWGYADVEGDGTVPEGKRDLALRAVHDCPMNAISYEE